MGGLIGTANEQNNGLYPSREAKKTIYSFPMNPGDIKDTGFTSGLIMIGRGRISHSALFLFGYNTGIGKSLVDTEGFDETGIYVYKDTASGTIKIQNNTDVLDNVWYSMLTCR